MATSGAAGFAYRAVNRKATSTAVKAFGHLHKIQSRQFHSKNSGAVQLSLFRLAREQRALKLVEKASKNSKILGRIAAPLRLGGIAAGSLLVGIGTAKLADAFKKKSITIEQSATIGSTVALSAFLVGGYGKPGLRRALKPVYISAYPRLRQLKTLLRL